MIKLIHAADLHLDSPFGGLHPEMAAQRRAEQRDLLARLVELARERQADALLLSGDLLDTGRVFWETAQMLRSQLGAAGCPVFIAPGNHDFYGGRSPYATLTWPDNVHIFRSAQMTTVELPGKDCQIHGAAFLAPKLDRSPLSDFSAPADGQVHVAVLHGDVEGPGDYGPIQRGDIASSGLTYLALGHVHKASGLQREGDTFWAYPGCPEGRGFDELGEKGALYLELKPGQCRAEFVPLCRHRYQILDVDLTGAQEPLSAIRAALPNDSRADIYRIILGGERSDSLDLAALETALEPDFFGLTLRDRTKPSRQLWDRMEEDTLTGLFLREMAAACREKPDDETLQLAVRFGLAALEGGEDAAP